MRTITKKELSEILEKHKKWLNADEGGEKADLRDTDLRGEDLRKVDLREASLDCADLRAANLQSANLQHTNFRKAKLQSINLQNADLQFADLRGANLTQANMPSTNLQCADLSNANVRHANVRNANLKDANLHGVDLYMTDIDGSVYRPWLVITDYIGSRRSKALYFADYDSVRCGCWNNYRGGTLAEFKERIDEVYSADDENKICQRYRLEYLSAIKMFESMRHAYIEETMRYAYIEGKVQKSNE